MKIVLHICKKQSKETKQRNKQSKETMNRITMCIIFFTMMTLSFGEELTGQASPKNRRPALWRRQFFGETCPVTPSFMTPSFITPTSTPKNTKIFLGDVKSLTFVQGEMTTSQRTTQIPQVTCYGENCYMAPKEITCKNLGLSDYSGDYVWNCDSSMLPGKFTITMADVNCEGYSYKEDPLITEGSCGITFRIGEVSFIPILIIFILLCLLFYYFPEFILIALISACISALLGGGDDDYDSYSFSASTSRR